MTYKEPTFEEYKKATKYARFRYSFGTWIQLIALFLLIILIYYVASNVEEFKQNPIVYGVAKSDVSCYCTSNDQENFFQVYVNETGVYDVNNGG